MARGGIDNKDEIREKTIRVRKWTYDQLRDICKMGMDFDDAITKLIRITRSSTNKNNDDDVGITK
ncbi:MAG: hypothetical protein M3382_02085 [Thermoproteota archaeon]|nr:hypothetical protein [Thermoproteota archaeon]